MPCTGGLLLSGCTREEVKRLEEEAAKSRKSARARNITSQKPSLSTGKRIGKNDARRTQTGKTRGHQTDSCHSTIVALSRSSKIENWIVRAQHRCSTRYARSPVFCDNSEDDNQPQILTIKPAQGTVCSTVLVWSGLVWPATLVFVFVHRTHHLPFVPSLY